MLKMRQATHLYNKTSIYNAPLKTAIPLLLVPSLGLWLYDYYFRDLSYAQHFLILLSLVCLHTLLITSLLWLKGWFKYLLGAVVCILIGTTHFVQFEYYKVYQAFIGPAEINIIVNNLAYWQHSDEVNKVEMLLGSAIVSVVLFLLYLPALSNTKANLHLPWISFVALLAFISSDKQTYSAEIQMVDNIIKSSKLNKVEKLRIYNAKKRNRAELIESPAERDKPNVLIILNESLRAKSLSGYGYARETMPKLNARFPNMLRFDAIANATVTPPAVEAVMTGHYHLNATPHTRTAPMIWDYFHQAGYRTLYSGSHWLKWNNTFDLYTLDKRFIDFSNYPLTPNVHSGRSDKKTVEILTKQLNQISEPFFAILHTRDNHYVYTEDPEITPFQPSQAHRDKTKIHTVINLYDNSILSLDNILDKFFDDLGSEKLDNTIVVFASDHGEAFYEHDSMFHTTIFWQEVLNVPLMISLPESLEISDAQQQHLQANQTKLSSNVDILPTLLELINLNTPQQFAGQSLASPRQDGFVLSMSSVNHYSLIHSVSREKVWVNNIERWIRIINLLDDPEENNAITYKLTKKLHYADILQYLPNDKVGSISKLPQSLKRDGHFLDR